MWENPQIFGIKEHIILILWVKETSQGKLEHILN